MTQNLKELADVLAVPGHIRSLHFPAADIPILEFVKLMIPQQKKTFVLSKSRTWSRRRGSFHVSRRKLGRRGLTGVNRSLILGITMAVTNSRYGF
jgi:hypothetical protein